MNLEQEKKEFDKAVDFLQMELGKLRTGRANTVMVEDLKVDYYGSEMPLKQLASISIPEARQIVIQPWDKGALQPLEKAVRDSGLGVNPVNEGDKLRIKLPELTEERRRELVKMAGKIAEEARVRVRSAREDVWKAIQKQEDDGSISEDEKFRLKDQLQAIVDDYNKKIKESIEKKEKEIMTV